MCPVAVSTMSSNEKQGRMAGCEEKGECSSHVAQHGFCLLHLIKKKKLAERRTMQLIRLGQQSSSCDSQLVLHLTLTDKPLSLSFALDLNLKYLLEYIFNTWMCVSQTCCQ